MLIDTNRIRTDLGTQPRVEMNNEIINEYAESMQRGDKFPPINVLYDDENDYFILVDGFHRLFAHKQIRPNDQILAEVKPGTVLNATWDCLAVNQSHGLRRTNADKRNAVTKALLHQAGEGKADNAIAKHVGVGNEMVSRIHREMVSDGHLCDSQRCTVERNGKTYQQNTTNIGSHRAQTIKMTGSGYTPVKAPPPFAANCGGCRFFNAEDDANRLSFGTCDADDSKKAGIMAACEDWEVYVPEPPVVTDTEPPKNVPLEQCEFWEPSSIRGPREPYEKTRDAVRILFHLKNPEAAACELRNACNYKYMTEVWAAYKKLITDPE